MGELVCILCRMLRCHYMTKAAELRLYGRMGLSAIICQTIVCLFGVFIPLEIFETYSDVTVTSERLQTLTYALHLWPFEPLSSEGSLACHIYNDTGHLFIMVHDTHTY